MRTQTESDGARVGEAEDSMDPHPVSGQVLLSSSWEINLSLAG